MAPIATTKTRTKNKVPPEHKTKVEVVKRDKKPKVLAPPSESDGESEVQPKKPQLRSSKQQPKYISANANAKSVNPAMSNVKSISLKKRKAKSPTPSNSDKNVESDEGDEGMVEQDADSEAKDVHLHGFSTDEDNSSDEEGDKPGLSVFEISRLPTVAKDDETVRRKLEKAKRRPTEDRGVVYIGRLPHGFYEDQCRGYFSQFGDVTRLRISRNKRTGKCKHYGFIEFDSSSVAQIVAETMDNYLLSGHILKCKVIPKEEVHSELWIGANKKWKVVPRGRIAGMQQNKPRTSEQRSKATQRLVKRQNVRKRKLEALGIDYDFDAASYKKSKATEKV